MWGLLFVEYYVDFCIKNGEFDEKHNYTDLFNASGKL